MASVKLKPFTLPAVDLPGWLEGAGHTKKWDVHLFDTGQYRVPPIVIVSDETGKHRIDIRCIDTRLGVEMIFHPFPMRHEGPSLHLIFRHWDRTKALSAVYACAAMQALRPRLRKVQQSDWLRRVYEKTRIKINSEIILARWSDYDEGPMPARVVDTLDARWKSLMKLDVVEAKDRLAREFQFLTDHMDLDEVVDIWNSIITQKVMSG